MYTYLSSLFTKMYTNRLKFTGCLQVYSFVSFLGMPLKNLLILGTLKVGKPEIHTIKYDYIHLKGEIDG